MNARALVTLFVIAAFASVTFFGSSSVRAQPPSLAFTLYQGYVTVAGEPAADGLEIKARVAGTSYVSSAVETSGGRYIALRVGPHEGANGSSLEFILEDQVVATTTDIYALPNCGVDSCPASRVFDVNFGTGPVPPTPVPSLPARYSGFISADGQTPADSAPFKVRIGPDYEATNGTLLGGDFSVIVDPKDISLSESPVEFFLYDVKAAETVPYRQGEIIRNLWLTFAGVPTPIPVSTATSEPTAVPTTAPEATTVPTVVPTAVPRGVPTPVSTVIPAAVSTAVSTVVPTAVPTPVPTVAPTAVPTAILAPVSSGTSGFITKEEIVGKFVDEVISGNVDIDEAVEVLESETSEGGMCAANPGGPASLGQLGLILSPLGLALWLRMKRHRIPTVE